jgi:hypothetical protein
METDGVWEYQGSWSETDGTDGGVKLMVEAALN